MEAMEEKEGMLSEAKEGGGLGVGGIRFGRGKGVGDGGGASRMAHSSAVTCNEELATHK